MLLLLLSTFLFVFISSRSSSSSSLLFKYHDDCAHLVVVTVNMFVTIGSMTVVGIIAITVML